MEFLLEPGDSLFKFRKTLAGVAGYVWQILAKQQQRNDADDHQFHRTNTRYSEHGSHFALRKSGQSNELSLQQRIQEIGEMSQDRQ
jgi:hypothetical protein